MACVMQDYPLYYDAVNEMGLGIAGLNFVGNAHYGKPQDGAVIRVRFTLALGKDIGGFNADAGVYGASSGNYYREW